MSRLLRLNVEIVEVKCEDCWVFKGVHYDLSFLYVFVYPLSKLRRLQKNWWKTPGLYCFLLRLKEEHRDMEWVVMDWIIEGVPPCFLKCIKVVLKKPWRFVDTKNATKRDHNVLNDMFQQTRVCAHKEYSNWYHFTFFVPSRPDESLFPMPWPEPQPWTLRGFVTIGSSKKRKYRGVTLPKTNSNSPWKYTLWD